MLIISELSETPEGKYCRVSFCEIPGVVHFIETESRKAGAGGGERGELVFHGCSFRFAR